MGDDKPIYRNLRSSRRKPEIKEDIIKIPERIGKIILEILLMNIRGINADKIQQLVDEFLIKRKYSSIFCLTETMVKSINFKTQGIKMHTKEREITEKNGGGLAIFFCDFSFFCVHFNTLCLEVYAFHHG